MLYKKKVLNFTGLTYPVTVFAKSDADGMCVGIKTLTADGKEYSVTTRPVKVEPAPSVDEFADFYNTMLGDATEYSEDLRAAGLDIQMRTAKQLIAYLSDTDFVTKEHDAQSTKLYH